MMIFNNFAPLRDVTSPQESTVTVNTQGEVATFQVSGDATGLQLSVMGQVDFQSDEWFPLSCINLTGFTSVATIQANGLYQVPLEGIGRFKFNVAAINSGGVSVFCRVTKGV